MPTLSAAVPDSANVLVVDECCAVAGFPISTVGAMLSVVIASKSFCVLHAENPDTRTAWISQCERPAGSAVPVYVHRPVDWLHAAGVTHWNCCAAALLVIRR